MKFEFRDEVEIYFLNILQRLIKERYYNMKLRLQLHSNVATRVYY